VIAAPPNKVEAAMRAAPIDDLIIPSLSYNGNRRRPMWSLTLPRVGRASGAENFVRQPEKTFSTVSVIT